MSGVPGKAALPAPAAFKVVKDYQYEVLDSRGVLKALRWNRVYIGDFLGPGGLQYVKAGTSGRVRARLVDLIREANRYGFVLMDVWVSLPLRDGVETERRILRACEGTHGVRHYAERFWGLPFEKAVAAVETPHTYCINGDPDHDCHLWG